MSVTVNCDACNTPLKRDDFDKSDGTYQFDNNLVIGLFGGYGMFVESPSMHDNSNAKNLKEDGATFEANICHDCAHKLCEENPWLERIINTHNAHSHHYKYIEENPDHYGWDYDEN